MSYIIYSDLEFLIKRIDGCKNNYEKSSATKKVNRKKGISFWEFKLSDIDI